MHIHLCKDIQLGELLLQEATKQLSFWSMENELTFSLSKSTTIYICKRYKCLHTLNIYLNNYQIHISNYVKYVGINFDKNTKKLIF